MVNILHIETSTEICSVSISENAIPIYTKESHEGYQHARAITLFVEGCLKASGTKMNEIDAIAVSSGPGSYTGLRVGVSCAKALCYANDIPLISVDTLRSLAWATLQEAENNITENTLLCPMIDARRMEVYTAIYDTTLAQKLGTKALIINSEAFLEEKKWSNHFVLSGNGAEKSKSVLGDQFHLSEVRCSASHMVSIAYQKFMENCYENMAQYVPNYLKQPNITISKK